MNVLNWIEKKQQKQKISMVTCYDYSFAKILSTTEVDSLLVGDSLAMTMHGHSSTLPATVNIMALHTAAVARGASNKFIVGDMPFLSFRSSLHHSMMSVKKIMQAGAQAVKLEGARGNLQLIQHVVDSGIPVMGHLGLTPQSIHGLGGYKVQGKSEFAQEQLLKDAEDLQAAGCFAVVLECVPENIANQITRALHIPTIGIGAGKGTDGQVLVLQDMLGMNTEFHPKFVRQYLDGASLIKDAINTYHSDVIAQKFPSEKETYK